MGCDENYALPYVSPSEREASQVRVALEDRGYEGPATVVYGGIVKMGTKYMSPPLLHHRPCGNAVFDPDIHDQHCPARRTGLGTALAEVIDKRGRKGAKADS